MDRIAGNEEYLRELIRLSNEIFIVRRREVAEEILADKKRLEELALKKQQGSIDEKGELELASLQEKIARKEKYLNTDSEWVHDLRNWPFGIARLHWLVADRKDQEVIDYLRKIAKKHPTIEFDESLGFMRRKRINDVELYKFLGPEYKENILYIRDYREGEQYNKIDGIFKDLEQNGVKFPTSMQTLVLHEKMVVKENKQLEKHAFPMEQFSVDNLEGLIEFYKQHCKEEGMVIKPYLIYGGNAIFFLSSNISDDKIESEMRKILSEFKSRGEELKLSADKKGSFDFSKVIVQKRLLNLDSDSVNGLYAGDIRMTAINGKLIGEALRYQDGQVEGALSYCKCRNLLPNNMPFTMENIASCLGESEAEGNQSKISYYKNMAAVYEAAQEVTKWCGEQGHFHVGFDILIGRNSKGEWTYSLTELNVGWPDCVPEHRWLNQLSGRIEEARVTDNIMAAIKSGEFISPSRLKENSELKPAKYLPLEDKLKILGGIEV